MRHLKLFLIFISLVIIAIISINCGSGDQSSVANALFKALQKENAEELEGYILEVSDVVALIDLYDDQEELDDILNTTQVFGEVEKEVEDEKDAEEYIEKLWKNIKKDVNDEIAHGAKDISESGYDITWDEIKYINYKYGITNDIIDIDNSEAIFVQTGYVDIIFEYDVNYFSIRANTFNINSGWCIANVGALRESYY